MDETTEYVYSGCSSMLAKLPDGSIAHGRHLDYDPADALRMLTYHATFVRGGKEVF